MSNKKPATEPQAKRKFCVHGFRSDNCDYHPGPQYDHDQWCDSRDGMESRKCDCGFEDRLLAKIAALKEEVERLEDQFSAACETIKITADERDALAAKMAEVERLKEKNLFLQTQVWDLDALAADLKAENERLRARGEELRNGIDTILFAAGIAVNAPRPNWQVIVDELRILASRQKEKE